MKKFFLILPLLFITLVAFSQSDKCKKYKRLVKKEMDAFTNETKYYTNNSPIYIIEKSDSVELVWDIVIDDMLEKKYNKLSVLCDKELVEFPITENNATYSKVVGRKYGSIFSGTSIVFTGEDDVFNRCIITLKNEQCYDIISKILNSKKNRIRVWSDTELDFSYSIIKLREMKNLINLYECLR